MIYTEVLRTGETVFRIAADEGEKIILRSKDPNDDFGFFLRGVLRPFMGGEGKPGSPARRINEFFDSVLRGDAEGVEMNGIGIFGDRIAIEKTVQRTYKGQPGPVRQTNDAIAYGEMKDTDEFTLVARILPKGESNPEEFLEEYEICFRKYELSVYNTVTLEGGFLDKQPGPKERSAMSAAI